MSAKKLFNNKIIIFSIASSLLVGCSSNNTASTNDSVDFNHELYEGKSTLGLTGDFPPENAKEALLRGDQAYLANDSDLALYEYIRALSFPSQEYADQAFYKIGYIHQQRGNFELAKLAYTRAALIAEDNIQYAASVGIVELKLGEQDNAKKQLLRAIKMDQQRQGKSDWDSEKDLFSQRLLIDSNSPLSAYIGLGIISDLDAKHKPAQQIYLTALSVNNRSEKALTNLGYSYYLDGNLKQSEIINRRTTTLYPNNKRAWSNLGLTYIKSKQYEDALDALSNVMPREKALNDIGYFAMLEGDYESAINYLERAVNTSPTFYAKAQENLKRAQKLQISAPAVKLSKYRDSNQTQTTVYSITDTTH
ncbi:tetratricopeptide repeat protein [Photobacterium sp. DNB23_23_1]|uniref:Flp pilus assembly protein TadD n=1 Tax=Photobacterium pectinilyticum TaxID=2906793 RepID=A0ABT1N4T5_9GAMM|nr:Flp pilus assembly protein TadD [Photobacterium sp. ZSDE20]MCQ1058874.1 Flp pilus assembly protein TadD [Photobacterium sp. ZSDE20]MDD1823836.1 Flp pilus assembly protein TadD [Photobacterium sp. ZSDE20]